MIKKYTKSILYNTFVIYTISLSNAVYVWYIHATCKTIMQEHTIASSFYNYEHIDNFFEKMSCPSHISVRLKGTLHDIREWLAQEPAVYIDCSNCRNDHDLCIKTAQHIAVPNNLTLVSSSPEQILIKVSHE